MLARHLLFLATRRPKKALLITQPVSTSSCGQKPQQPQQPHQQHHQAHKQQQNHSQPQQPPPYVGPPQVHVLHKGYPYPLVYDNRHHPNPQLRQGLPQLQPQHTYHHHQQPLIHHIIDPYQQMVFEKTSLHHQLPYSNYTENQKIYAHQPIQGCDKAQQQQHFYTLPNRRPQREVIVDPPRSITPDITRGLGRGPLSAMHMLARQGQKSGSAEKLVSHYHGQGGHNCQMDLGRKSSQQQFEDPRYKGTQQRQQAPVDVKNRFASPPCLSSLGYRLFASPLQDTSLRSAPISPIGPEHANGFKSSTPTGNRSSTPSVAERLALQSQRCASPNPALMRHGSAEKLVYSSDSGRSTPTNNNNNNPNIILSPIKSTMSNEELFAAIHKSKKRLNIREDPESLSPANSLTSLSKNQQAIGTRHSWSPESQKTPEIPKSVLSPSQTSRLDFKRLLLQQNLKSGPTRISAAEQLKLSRQQCQESQQLQQHPSGIVSKSSQQIPLTKVLSPRSAWRFQTPRTDVLSSTIIEDTAAEEKAMKPSPENPSPVSKLPLTTPTRRQLDLTNDSRNSSKNLEELKNVINDNKNQRTLEKREKELENRLQAIDLGDAKKVDNSGIDNPIKAIESRRMSNQLARAQFLASSTPTNSQSKDLFNRRFRARSESPQQNDHQRTAPSVSNAAGNAAGTVVTRSPSAPTLETAL